MSFEIRIYVLKYAEDENGNRLDEEQREALSDEDFIDMAENEGGVHSLHGFLREIEAGNVIPLRNATLRAYMVHNTSLFAPLRIDIPELTFDSISPNFEEAGIGEPIKEEKLRPFKGAIPKKFQHNGRIEDLLEELDVKYVDYRPQSIKLIVEDKEDWRTPPEIRLEIHQAMQALAENLNSLPLQDPEIFEKLPIDEVTQIICDTSNQYDEFYITDDYEENIINVEVVTRETAISNDLDFMSGYNDGRIADYHENGECDSDMSMYNKLGTSGYYFRLL